MLSRWFTLCLALFSASPALAETAAVRLYTEELPPFNFKQSDGRITGSSTEKVEAIFRDASLAYEIDITSWPRAYETARTQAACVYSTARTAEREASFAWIGPLIRNDAVMFGMADKASASNDTLENARNTRIGGYYGAASSRVLTQRGYKVLMSTNHDIALKNLLAGRLDYWVAMKDTGEKMIEQNGLQGKVVQRIHIATMDLYLACNPAVDSKVLQRLQQSFKLLSGNGSFAAIDRRYAN